jgi:hypothetical protein
MVYGGNEGFRGGFGLELWKNAFAAIWRKTWTAFMHLLSYYPLS